MFNMFRGRNFVNKFFNKINVYSKILQKSYIMSSRKIQDIFIQRSGFGPHNVRLSGLIS